VTELWRVLAGEHGGRATASAVTVFDSVGFALEDYSALRYVYEKAKALDIGIDADLVPPADDPKDLFRHTRGGARRRAQLKRAA
jgi:ornithine cyclodeaminase